MKKTDQFQALGFLLALFTAPALAQSDGIRVLQNLTTPRGGAWLNGSLGGHFWVPDGVLGICRVNANGSTFQTGNCNGSAKAPGQVATGTSPAGTTYVFVPDSSTKS